MVSIDVNGFDNTPEWGYCRYPGCTEEAEPIWLSGDYPDDPDLYLCRAHIGSKINALTMLLRTVIGCPRWRSIGGIKNVAELHIDRVIYEAAAKEVY